MVATLLQLRYVNDHIVMPGRLVPSDLLVDFSEGRHADLARMDQLCCHALPSRYVAPPHPRVGRPCARLAPRDRRRSVHHRDGGGQQ